MSSPTHWTWVWVNSGSWWCTGRPGLLRFMGSPRVRQDWATELNWTELRGQFHKWRQVQSYRGRRAGWRGDSPWCEWQVTWRTSHAPCLKDPEAQVLVTPKNTGDPPAELWRGPPQCHLLESCPHHWWAFSLWGHRLTPDNHQFVPPWAHIAQADKRHLDRQAFRFCLNIYGSFPHSLFKKQDSWKRKPTLMRLGAGMHSLLRLKARGLKGGGGPGPVALALKLLEMQVFALHLGSWESDAWREENFELSSRKLSRPSPRITDLAYLLWAHTSLSSFSPWAVLSLLTVWQNSS